MMPVNGGDVTHDSFTSSIFFCLLFHFLSFIAFPWSTLVVRIRRENTAWSLGYLIQVWHKEIPLDMNDKNLMSIVAPTTVGFVRTCLRLSWLLVFLHTGESREVHCSLWYQLCIVTGALHYISSRLVNTSDSERHSGHVMFSEPKTMTESTCSKSISLIKVWLFSWIDWSWILI